VSDRSLSYLILQRAFRPLISPFFSLTARYRNMSLPSPFPKVHFLSCVITPSAMARGYDRMMYQMITWNWMP
jgi:hypothetical protein